MFRELAFNKYMRMKNRCALKYHLMMIGFINSQESRKQRWYYDLSQNHSIKTQNKVQ